MCDRTIAANESNVDLASLAPGAVVCLFSSTSPRGPLRLTNLAGSPAAPIVIRNCDGAVRLESTTTSRPLFVTGHDFRITGAGTPGVQYGLVLSGPMAAAALGLGPASGFEVDHVEITASAFAGIMAKVDPSSTNCQTGDRRFDPFVMDGVHLHHLFIHDVDGEGIYLGNSFYLGTTTQYCGGNAACDNAPCGGVQYPHEVRNVDIHDVTVERCGWDGIQVGAAVDGCSIHDNVIRQFGLENRSSQNHGLQVGDGSSCIVERNLIDDGSIAMQLAGIGGTELLNNVVVNVRTQVAYVNPRPTPLATDVVDRGYKGGFRILHNTFIVPLASIVFRDINVPGNPVPAGNVLANNLVVSSNMNWTQLTSTYIWMQSGNLRYADVMAAGLVSPSTGDYCLATSAPGTDTAGMSAVDEDHRGAPRPLGTGPDVGAFECH